MNKFEARLKICLLVGTRNPGLFYGKIKLELSSHQILRWIKNQNIRCKSTKLHIPLWLGESKILLKQKHLKNK